MDNLYTVGVIAGTHGLRGEVRVFPRTDFPKKRFAKGSVLHPRAGIKGVDALTVATARPHKQFWLVAFEGYENINDVDGWKGVELCVPEEALTKLPKDTYYIHQLIGLRVVTDDNREVGIITDVLQPGANDVYVVRGPLQKQDVLIPAIPDCVLEVNLESKTMTVHLMPGLLAEEADGSSNGEHAGNAKGAKGTSQGSTKGRQPRRAAKSKDLASQDSVSNDAPSNDAASENP